MKCPVCVTVDLRMADRQGIEIDYCPQCRGVWLDRGELDKLIEREASFSARPAAPPPAAGVPYAAPQNAPYRREYDDDRYEYEKRKNDEYYRRDYDDDEHKKYPPNDPRYKKRKSVLGEIFDIFGD